VISCNSAQVTQSCCLRDWTDREVMTRRTCLVTNNNVGASTKTMAVRSYRHVSSPPPINFVSISTQNRAAADDATQAFVRQSVRSIFFPHTVLQGTVRYSRELCGTPGNCAVLQGTVRKSRELCGNPGNCADENQDTLSVESVFWMAFGGGYDQSNTEEGAHHRQAE
jgi:hypothetical protein